MIPVSVLFQCCGEERIFTSPGEFRMCTCGKSGYDAGNSYYSRVLGNREDVKITSLFNQVCEEDLIRRGIPYYIKPNGGVVAQPSPDLNITCKHPGRFMLSAYGDDWVSYCTLKSALAKCRKLLRGRE